MKAVSEVQWAKRAKFWKSNVPELKLIQPTINIHKKKQESIGKRGYGFLLSFCINNYLAASSSVVPCIDLFLNFKNVLRATSDHK